MSTTQNYFAMGHTARGLYSLYSSAFENVERLYILEGGYGAGKSHLLRRVAITLQQRGEPLELFHSPLYPDSLDGLIMSGGKIGIVDGMAYRSVPFMAPGIRETFVNLWTAVQTEKLKTNKQQIIQLHEQISASYQRVFDAFLEALRIHDDWEKYYIRNIDLNKADKVTTLLSNTLFARDHYTKQSAVRHRFFGAATPDGAVDHIQSLTENMEKRIFLKGRPGSGKSTILKKLAATAESKGLDVDVFHCGFDPNSLDMLIFPELGVAIFDSTAPHEYFPDRQTDEIVDMYELIITPGTDEKYKTEIDPIKGRYSAKMKEATSYLSEVREIRDQIKGLYTAATDYPAVQQMTSHLEKEILE